MSVRSQRLNEPCQLLTHQENAASSATRRPFLARIVNHQDGGAKGTTWFYLLAQAKQTKTPAHRLVSTVLGTTALEAPQKSAGNLHSSSDSQSPA